LCIVALVPAFFLEGRKPSPYFIRRRGDNTYFPDVTKDQKPAIGR